jgi:hypothetical protein
MQSFAHRATEFETISPQKCPFSEGRRSLPQAERSFLIGFSMSELAIVRSPAGLDRGG